MFIINLSFTMRICCANQVAKNNEQKVIALNEKETQELGKENDSVQEDKKGGEEICWTQFNTLNPKKLALAPRLYFEVKKRDNEEASRSTFNFTVSIKMHEANEHFIL